MHRDEGAGGAGKLAFGPQQFVDGSWHVLRIDYTRAGTDGLPLNAWALYLDGAPTPLAAWLQPASAGWNAGSGPAWGVGASSAGGNAQFSVRYVNMMVPRGPPNCTTSWLPESLMLVPGQPVGTTGLVMCNALRGYSAAEPMPGMGTQQQLNQTLICNAAPPGMAATGASWSPASLPCERVVPGVDPPNQAVPMTDWVAESRYSRALASGDDLALTPAAEAGYPGAKTPTPSGPEYQLTAVGQPDATVFLQPAAVTRPQALARFSLSFEFRVPPPEGEGDMGGGWIGQGAGSWPGC